MVLSIPMLLTWPLLFIAYSLTLSTLFFTYSPIILLVRLIAMINIQPLKKIGRHYPLVDIIFTSLLCFFQVIILGEAISIIGKYNPYYAFVTTIGFLTSAIPIIYTSFLITSWLFSKINIVCIPHAVILLFQLCS